ncbi:MAG: fibronectin type III domain-containing protein [Reinekea sp.]|nr:fibronectin type III domain-containing protein [Reinekea sp.]
MNILHLVAAALLASLLTGCQIEVLPLDQDDNVNVDGADNTTNTETDTNNENTDPGNGDTGPGGGTDNDGDNGGGNSGEIKTSVTLYWSTPFKRVNGEPLSTDDISGYEIRYRKTSDTEFQHVFIDNAATEQYQFTGLDNALMYQFELAVVDKNGIYSEFITAVE